MVHPSFAFALLRSVEKTLLGVEALKENANTQEKEEKREGKFKREGPALGTRYLLFHLTACLHYYRQNVDLCRY